MTSEPTIPLACDERFVAGLYEQHCPAIFRKCLALSGGDVRWSEDVTHDVFVRLLECRDEVDVTRNVGGWLRTVTYRLCLDRLRRERTTWTRIKTTLAAVEADCRRPDPDSELQIKMKLQRTEALLAVLSPKERAAVLLKYLEGLKQNEMAKVLGWSEGYVSKVLSRATRRIRQAGWEVEDDQQ
jgi:RNA polymerase sigma factor (sigma-70 family)